MKLISINELKAAIGNWRYHKHMQEFKIPNSISLTELADLIETTPTVEAIPMWYIEKKLKHYQRREKYLQDFPGVNDAEISRETIEYLIIDWKCDNDNTEGS